jgi:hypothetical protein
MRDRAPSSREPSKPAPSRRDGSSVAPPKTGLEVVDRMAGSRSALQFEARNLPPPMDGATLRQRAAEGFSGTPTALPHLARIQQSFGEHGRDLGRVKAHVGGPAASAARAMGASAYASGGSIAFSSAPSLRTAAHEAAHVIQQRAGVVEGVGTAGDRHEQQADAVAEAVVAGRSAASLLAGASGGEVPAVQRNEVADAQPTSAGPEPPAEVEIDTQSQDKYGPTPWIWNQWLPGNGGRASPEYTFHKRMTKAAAASQAYPGTLDRAAKALASAKAKLDAANKAAAGNGGNPKQLAAAAKAAQKAFEQATSKHAEAVASKAKIEAELTNSQAAFKAWLLVAVKHQMRKNLAGWPAVKAEIDAYQPIQHYEQTTYVVTINGKSVRLTDHAQAYSTELAEGLGGTVRGDTHAAVEAAVDATRFGPDDKAVMKAISVHEGTFTTTESYDIGGVTWGFLQWTTGLDGRGSVIHVLNKIKATAPEAYRTWFLSHGIDVKNGALIVKRSGKPDLVGPDAVKAVRTDPTLSAAFALSGTDPQIQNAQLEIAKVNKMDRDGLDRTATVTFGKGKDAKSYTYKARDIFTSEWGAAIVANAGVHAGPGRVSERLASGLKAFLTAHPKLDRSAPSQWAAQAEAFIAPRMIAGDAERSKAFAKRGLSKDSGTYDGSIPDPKKRFDFGSLRLKSSQFPGLLNLQLQLPQLDGFDHLHLEGDRQPWYLR